MFSVIVKPTGLWCNLACSYCFYKDRREEQRIPAVMSAAVLDRTIQEVIQSSGKVADFNWLGGEPLLAGMDFFRETVMLQKHYKLDGQAIINKIQTNGTLVNSAWLEFFLENDFQVGISCDGPKIFHDRFRYDDRGRSVFEKVQNSIELLAGSKVRFGVICVVNSHNAAYPEAIYNFFIGLGVNSLAFNPAKGRDEENGKLLESSVEPQQYAEFMIKMFDRWMKDDNPKFVIRQFRSIMQSLLGGKYRLCGFAGRCWDFLAITRKGDIYPCQDERKDGVFCFGNINEGIKKALSSATYQEFKALAQKIREKCLSCRWYHVCRGGCNRDYYLHFPGVRHTNFFCVAHQKLYRHIADRLKKEGALLV